MRILESNAKKNFVQRIINPKAYPTMPLEGGQVGTHLMAWAENDGKYIVYPTIQWDGKQLVNWGPDRGFNEAMKQGEFIEFGTPQEADWFSRSYKRAWDNPINMQDGTGGVRG